MVWKECVVYQGIFLDGTEAVDDGIDAAEDEMVQDSENAGAGRRRDRNCYSGMNAPDEKIRNSRLEMQCSSEGRPFCAC